MGDGFCVGEGFGEESVGFSFGVEEVVVRVYENHCGFRGCRCHFEFGWNCCDCKYFRK